MSEAGDPGLFGPQSVSWTVLREAPVMVGGLRAILMHSAHPLLVAAADQTKAYAHEPWPRLRRTLELYLTITFGSTTEAHQAVSTVNRTHRDIKGVDRATGHPYSARDPALLLWVHGCLVTSFLHFERVAVGRLDDLARQRFHEEQAQVAELLGLRRSAIPAGLDGLAAGLQAVIDSGILRLTRGGQIVAATVRRPPRKTPYVRSLRIAQLLAFESLPPEIASIYNIDPAQWRAKAANHGCELLRKHWSRMPDHQRFIAPYRRAVARVTGASELRPGGLFWNIVPTESRDQVGDDR